MFNSNNDYSLEVRQQPHMARVAGPKEKERKPVDPQPIIQLKITDYEDPTDSWEHCPHFFLMASLWLSQHDEPVAGSQAHALGGSVVASLHRLRDDQNQDGAYFIFHDLAIKYEGVFRLRFTLFELRKDSEFAKPTAIHIKSVISQQFQVYAAKDFPGMSESSSLARTFADQGIKLRIRKSNSNGASKRLKYAADYDSRHGFRQPSHDYAHGYYGQHSSAPLSRYPPNVYMPQPSWNHSSGNYFIRTGNVSNGYGHPSHGPSPIPTSVNRPQYVGNDDISYGNPAFLPSDEIQRRAQDLGASPGFRQQNSDGSFQTSDSSRLNNSSQGSLVEETFMRSTSTTHDSLPTSSQDRNLPPISNTSLPNRDYGYEPSHVSSQAMPQCSSSWSAPSFTPQVARLSNPPVVPPHPLSPPDSKGNSTSYGNKSQYPNIMQ